MKKTTGSRDVYAILFLNHKLVGARHIETFQSSNTTLARFSSQRRCPSYSLPYQFPSKVRLANVGGGIIWAMDIFSIWKKGYMLCVYPQLLYSKWWKRIAVIRIHYFVCTVYLWAPPPRLNKIHGIYFLAPFRGVLQKYSPKKKNNVHTCTVYNVRKIKVYWKKKTKFLKVVEFSLEP